MSIFCDSCGRRVDESHWDDEAREKEYRLRLRAAETAIERGYRLDNEAQRDRNLYATLLENMGRRVAALHSEGVCNV